MGRHDLQTSPGADLLDKPDASVTADELRRVELLDCLPDHALEELGASCIVRHYPAGMMVFLEGDSGSSLYVIRRGMVKVVKQRAEQGDLVLQTLGPGGTFGLLAVFDPAPRSATVMAIDSSDIIELDKKDLDRVLDQQPEATRRMLGELARSLTMAKEQKIEENEILDMKVRERTAELAETQLEVIRRLGIAAEFRDDDTGAHIARMSRYCARLAEEIGFSRDQVERLLNAAPMHDVGKIGIPDGILLKPGKLDDDEFTLMKTHTTIGAQILSGSKSDVIQLAEKIALSHHEKWNGRGYPNGLSAEDIPLEGRIACVADVFDALTSERPYKKAWPVDEAFALIKDGAGKDFDPHLADAFLGIRPAIEEIKARYHTVGAGGH
ncbi:MAG TPA: HD domain-containing phosphohydrolase [Actinomycetota bacterium]|nr:HD domain-containing phosphohydrolase [Actinomycetota bacterium]